MHDECYNTDSDGTPQCGLSIPPATPAIRSAAGGLWQEVVS